MHRFAILSRPVSVVNKLGRAPKLNGESLMQRRAFLRFLCGGLGIASAATTAQALTVIKTLGSDIGRGAKPQPSVAIPGDMDSAKVEDVWYGHWRRVNRRHYRRVSRRVYRRRYY